MMMIRMIIFLMIMIDKMHIIIGPYIYIYIYIYNILFCFVAVILKEQRFSCLNFIIISTLSCIYNYDTATKILASPLHVMEKT